MRRSLPTALLLTALAAAFLAPTASASDQSVYDAYVSRDAALSRLGKQLVRTQREFRRSSFRDPEPTLRVLKRLSRVLVRLQRSVAGERASSRPGRSAKDAAIQSLRILRKS